MNQITIALIGQNGVGKATLKAALASGAHGSVRPEVAAVHEQVGRMARGSAGSPVPRAARRDRIGWIRFRGSAVQLRRMADRCGGYAAGRRSGGGIGHGRPASATTAPPIFAHGRRVYPGWRCSSATPTSRAMPNLPRSWKSKRVKCSPVSAIDGADIPVIRGSALRAIQNPLDADAWREIDALHNALDAYVPVPARNVRSAVSDAGRHGLRGRRPGRRRHGPNRARPGRPGEVLEIAGLMDSRTAVVIGVDPQDRAALEAADGDTYEQGIVGDSVTIILAGISIDQVMRGQVLAAPETVTVHTRFTVELELLAKQNGGKRSS